MAVLWPCVTLMLLLLSVTPYLVGACECAVATERVQAAFWGAFATAAFFRLIVIANRARDQVEHPLLTALLQLLTACRCARDRTENYGVLMLIFQRSCMLLDSPWSEHDLICGPARNSQHLTECGALRSGSLLRPTRVPT